MSKICGECTVCCTLCRVPELNKAEGTTCKNCNKGCSIYTNRPDSCKKYECAWLKSDLPDSLRPDKSGVMFEVYPEMVAALLVSGRSINSLSHEVLQVIDEYVARGLPVIATGQFAKLPIGMRPEEAKRRMIYTIKEVQNG